MSFAVLQLTPEEESSWGRFFRNAELEKMVDQDLLRLYPDNGSYLGESCCYGALVIKIVATDKVLQGKKLMFVLTNIEFDPTPTNTKNSKRIPRPVCRSLLQDLSCQLGGDEEGLEDIILGSEESTAMEENSSETSTCLDNDSPPLPVLMFLKIWC